MHDFEQLGMTGSGKTGLCISMLEEAALDGIPTLIVDPKGDLAASAWQA
jgi:DNA helicase HerA-like ATPase